MTGKGFALAATIVVACLTVLGIVSHFLGDWAWFSAVGYLDVFWTVLSTKAILFVGVFAASATVLWANGWLALRFASQGKTALPTQFEWQPVPALSLPDLWTHARRHHPVVVAGAAVALGLLIASVKTSKWDVALRFLFQVPYG